jgi:hypothetical protein
LYQVRKLFNLFFDIVLLAIFALILYVMWLYIFKWVPAKYYNVDLVYSVFDWFSVWRDFHPKSDLIRTWAEIVSETSYLFQRPDLLRKPDWDSIKTIADLMRAFAKSRDSLLEAELPPPPEELLHFFYRMGMIVVAKSTFPVLVCVQIWMILVMIEVALDFYGS